MWYPYNFRTSAPTRISCTQVDLWCLCIVRSIERVCRYRAFARPASQYECHTCTYRRRASTSTSANQPGAPVYRRHPATLATGMDLLACRPGDMLHSGCCIVCMLIFWHMYLGFLLCWTITGHCGTVLSNSYLLIVISTLSTVGVSQSKGCSRLGLGTAHAYFPFS